MQATIITALQFGPGMPATGLPVELKTDSSEALLCSLSDGPVAYVVELEQLRALDRIKDIVTSVGFRPPRQPMWRKLLTKRKADVRSIDGNFHQIGRLRGAIAKLLLRAQKNGQRGRYVIGVDRALLEQLLVEAEEAEMAERTRYARRDAAAPLELEWEDNVPRAFVEAFPGTSVAARRLRARMACAVWYRREVLLVGETGTPLEAVARGIDAPRGTRPRPFVAVDCAVNGDHSFEVLLCGDGASAGDAGRGAVPGSLTRAQGGTLFIEAVDELQPCQQAQLLHALERRELQTTAGACVPMMARIVVASRRDLKALVEAGRFNAELYHRLRPFTIRVPSLRDRPEDIAPIALAVWRDIISDSSATLPYDVEQALREYEWPGNHAQLEGVLCTLQRWCGTRRPTAADVRAVLQDYDAPLFGRPLQPRRRRSGRDD